MSRHESRHVYSRPAGSRVLLEWTLLQDTRRGLIAFVSGVILPKPELDVRDWYSYMASGYISPRDRGRLRSWPSATFQAGPLHSGRIAT